MNEDEKKGIDTMEKKMTKRDYFNVIKNLEEVQERPDLVAFIEHELELLTRKNSSTGEKKPTALQVANEELKDAICKGMEVDRPYTVTDLIKEIPECDGLSTSKVSAMVKQLLNEERVVKTIEKRKSYFTVKW